MSTPDAPRWRSHLRFTRADPDADVDDELRFHLEELVRHYRAEGMDPAAAQRAARDQFGDVDAMRQTLRNRSSHMQRRVERTEWWLRFRNDVRVGARKLIRQPGFTAAVVATLALGIGVNAGVFSVVNAALIRPLPYPGADRIVALDEIVKGKPFAVSPPNFTDWRAQAKSFTAMAAYNSFPRTLTGRVDAQTVPNALVTSDFFDVMGLQPVRGRAFAADEFVPGRTNVVILSDALWRSVFGASDAILGQPIQLDGVSRIVVGIMPPGFDFPSGSRAWTPWAFTAADLATQRGAHYLSVVARLRPAIAPQAAIAEIKTISDRLAVQYPSSSKGNSATGATIRDALVGETPRRALLILICAVALVTLIACANVANLALARGAARRHEMAVRASLGAMPRDLIGMALTESVLLSGLGGGAGVVVAWVSTKALGALRPESLQNLGAATVDPTVVAFTLGVSVLTGLLFGLAPAIQAVRASVGKGTLRGDGRGNTVGRAGWRARGGLVAAELALAVMLLAGAGLMIRSINGLERVQPGFATSGVLTFGLSLPDSRYPKPEQAGLFYSQLLERVRALPGVNGADGITGLPLDNYGYSISTHSVDNRALEPSTQPSTQVRIVTPGLFSTLHMRMVRGRSFTEADGASAPHVVIMSVSAERLLFGAASAIGHSVEISTSFGLNRGRGGGEIVGVVDDVRDDALGTPSRPTLYLVHEQFPVTDMTIVVHAADGTDPMALASPVQSQLRDLDRRVAMVSVRSLEQVARGSIADPRFAMILLVAFALVAVALAAVGIFGVISYVVGQRTREIGVRIALGAGTGAVVRETVCRALMPIAAGIGIGLVGAAMLSRTMTSLLYGVAPTDPATFVAVTAGIAIIGVVAAWLPARRASRVDPMVALRAE